MYLKGQGTFLTVNRPGFQMHTFCWWKYFITRGHQRFFLQNRTLIFFFCFNLCTLAQHYNYEMFWIAGSKDGCNSCPQELHTKIFKSSMRRVTSWEAIDMVIFLQSIPCRVGTQPGPTATRQDWPEQAPFLSLSHRLDHPAVSMPAWCWLQNVTVHHILKW